MQQNRKINIAKLPKLLPPVLVRYSSILVGWSVEIVIPKIGWLSIRLLIFRIFQHNVCFAFWNWVALSLSVIKQSWKLYWFTSILPLNFEFRHMHACDHVFIHFPHKRIELSRHFNAPTPNIMNFRQNFCFVYYYDLCFNLWERIEYLPAPDGRKIDRRDEF